MIVNVDVHEYKAHVVAQGTLNQVFGSEHYDNFSPPTQYWRCMTRRCPHHSFPAREVTADVSRAFLEATTLSGIIYMQLPDGIKF